MESDTRKANFLNILDQRFCTEDGFYGVRQRIRCRNLNIDDPHVDFSLMDYLGFFEILDVFHKKGILTSYDIYSQFGTYIMEAMDNESILKIVEEEKGQWRGFRHLAQDMRKVREKLQKEEQKMQKGKGKKGNR